ncbi:MAG: hypothetical protein A3H70_00440 [Candidatus Komeilibacteria bacterium RIFCSPLOWO2_02_FULL_48_11]|uniref:GP-PDE domain-containing protein n=1 Tax=Candidatus Komeilibacteria bacterium RIFCSPLOWO2_02_FULL_48_11 TaxID=1798553 RepID=A0A1G2BTT6_9BACT|nr:MAG: hypothetical protein A3H70_00440 [Candidatus Komeilibacteria bacterium RIFCSPLOWO2_02_FULL_48_11]
MIIAHRGYHQDYKENTLAAFEAAFASGADAIETDMRLTKDGQVVVNHNDEIRIQDKILIISQTSLSEILDYRGKGSERLLTLDELFEYIAGAAKPFFLELKSNSLFLVQSVIDKINAYNLWERAHVIGFRERIKTSLPLQANFPCLRICQILSFPLLSGIKMPPKSYAVFLGWLEALQGSELVFRTLISQNILARLLKKYQARGFQVMAGVINDPAKLERFIRAGITDVFTDNVPAVVEYFSKRPE